MRVLTALIGLRMSDEDRVAIEWKAKQLGYSSAQHWIRESIRPAVDRAKLEKRVHDETAPEMLSPLETEVCPVDGQ